MSRGLLFAHLNLRRNPFGELPAPDRVPLAVAELEPLLARLEGERSCLQLIGDHGRGKTTHLLALAARVPGARYLRVEEFGPAPAWPEAPLLLVDEAQFLSRWGRRRLLRRARALVLGTHDDLEPSLTRAGWRCATVRLAGLDETKLAEIVTRRIEAARRGPGPVPTLTPEGLGALVARFGDDLRGIEHHLYEVFQRLEACAALGVEQLDG